MEDSLISESLEFEIQTDIITLLENVKCQGANPSGLKQALLALATICSSRVESQDYFRLAGGIDELKGILLEGSCPLLAVPSALFCLACAVKQNVTSQNAVLTEELLTVIHELLSHEERNERIVQATAFLLACAVSGSGRGQRLACETKCLLDLISHLKNCVFEKCKDECQWSAITRAIGVCVNNPQNEKNQQISSCVLPHALKLICEEDEPEPVRHVLTLIGSVVANNASNQARVRQCGGIETLIYFIKKQTHHQDAVLPHSLIASAISALDACIAENDESAEQAGKLGVVPLLLDLLEDRGFGKNDLQILVLTLAHVLEMTRDYHQYVREGKGYHLLVSFLTETQEDELFKVIKYILTLCKTGDTECSKRLEASHEEENEAWEDSINHLTSSLHKKLADLQNQLLEIGHLSETFNSVHTASNMPDSLAVGNFGDSVDKTRFNSSTDSLGMNQKFRTLNQNDDFIRCGGNNNFVDTNKHFNNNRMLSDGNLQHGMHNDVNESYNRRKHTGSKEYRMYEDKYTASSQGWDSSWVYHPHSLRTYQEISSPSPGMLNSRKLSQFPRRTSLCQKRDVCSNIDSFKRNEQKKNAYIGAQKEVADNYLRFERSTNTHSERWDTTVNSQCFNYDFDSNIVSPDCHDQQKQNLGNVGKATEHLRSREKNNLNEGLTCSKQLFHDISNIQGGVENYISHKNVQQTDKDKDSNSILGSYLDHDSRQQSSVNNVCNDKYLIKQHKHTRKSSEMRHSSMSSRNTPQSPHSRLSSSSVCNSHTASSHNKNDSAAAVQSPSNIYNATFSSIAALQENQVRLFGQFQKMISSFFSSLMPEQLKKTSAFPVISDQENSNNLTAGCSQNVISEKKKDGNHCDDIDKNTKEPDKNTKEPDKNAKEPDFNAFYSNPEASEFRGSKHSSSSVGPENSCSFKNILTAVETIPTQSTTSTAFNNNEEAGSNKVFHTNALNKNVSKVIQQKNEEQSHSVLDTEDQKKKNNEDIANQPESSDHPTHENTEKAQTRLVLNKICPTHMEVKDTCHVDKKNSHPEPFKNLDKLDYPFLKPLPRTHLLSARSTANSSARKLTANIHRSLTPMSVCQPKRARLFHTSASKLNTPPQSPALSQFDNCLQKMAQKNASTFDMMKRKAKENEKTSYDSVTSGIGSMNSSEPSFHGNKLKECEGVSMLSQFPRSSPVKIVPLQRKNVRHVKTPQETKKEGVADTKSFGNTANGEISKGENSPKYSPKSLCPGCSAGLELNSRTYNIAIETSVHTCNYHRSLRQCEREFICSHSKRMKPLDHIDTSLCEKAKLDSSSSKDKEKDVYVFTSGSDKTVSSPCHDTSLASFEKLVTKKVQGTEQNQWRRPRIPYTEQEVENLMDGVARMGRRWQQILCTYEFHPSRTSVDLRDKYKRLMAINGEKSVPPFSMCEIRRLKRGIKSYGYNWKAILRQYKFLPGRRAEDLRKKWKALNLIG